MNKIINYLWDDFIIIAIVVSVIVIVLLIHMSIDTSNRRFSIHVAQNSYYCNDVLLDDNTLTLTDCYGYKGSRKLKFRNPANYEIIERLDEKSGRIREKIND